ncbi:unnamed protein product [Symbiodinium sp. CCMP2592]|nr:unnamed protein product [Symbiodinium sp. CCMP2592]
MTSSTELPRQAGVGENIPVLSHTGQAEPEPAGSPAQKRTRGDEHPNPGAATIDAMRELLRQNNAELKAEITQAVGQRVELVEKTVTSQLMDTVRMLQNITATQDEQGGAIKELRGGHQSLASRLSALELRSSSGAGSSWGSTTADESEKRKPAMIMGGWHEDQHAEQTSAAAKQMVTDLRIDLDVDAAFCPGVRRGFVIIPYEPRNGESEQQLRDRLRGATQRVLEANIELGKREDGTTRRLWLHLSQSPEKRRRAMVASKTKRLLLENGAPHGATNAGTMGAWIHMGQIARLLGASADDSEFHDGKQDGRHITAATWNVGGLDILRCAQLLDDMAGQTALRPTGILLLQEIVVPDPGIQYHVTIYGKLENDWRGEGIAYEGDLGNHERSCCMPGAIATTVKLHEGQRLGLLSGHIPHHATIQQVDNMVHGWSEAHWQGNALLQWAVEQDLYFPEPALQDPSHFPYNPGHKPRSIDYLLLRGSGASGGRVAQARDMAISDHEPVLAELLLPRQGRRPPPRQVTCGVKQLLHPEDVERELLQPPRQKDPYRVIVDKAQQIQNPTYRARQGYKESAELKAARRRAHNSRPGQDRLAEEASQLNWHAIFNAQKPGPADHINAIRGELTRVCKRTPWKPFTRDELETTAEKWKPRKSTGIDGVGYESFKAMLREPQWAHYILSLINDCFYKANVPETVGRGATVLLPKEQMPKSWAETRPITLSNTLLRWIAQLLLLRCQPYLDLHCYYQYCSTGRQAQELILALRRLMRMAKDWGVKLWIVKVDVRKAFDSIAQDALAVMVRDAVAKRGGLVWESRLWLEILEAKVIDVYVGKSLVSVTQSNGVRQGSPDSAVLYSASVGETLQELHDTVPLGKSGRPDLPACPSQGAGYMDDTYLWSEDAKAMQRSITHLEDKLGGRGNVVNVIKTQILCSQPDDTEFTIGGQKVKPGGGRRHHDSARLPAHVREKRGDSTHSRPAGQRSESVPCSQEITVRQNATGTQDQASDHPGAELCDLGVRHLAEQHSAATSSQQLPTQLYQSYARGEETRHRGLGRLASSHYASGRSGSYMDIQPDTRALRETYYCGATSSGGKKSQNPQDVERSIAKIGTYNWIEVAQNRDQWMALQADFVAEFDLPWASGRQPAIANLTQIPNFRPVRQSQLTSSGASGRMNPGATGATASTTLSLPSSA